MTFAEFPSERTASVSSRSLTVTSKSNFLTYTVAASVVCTSPLAVTTVVGLGIRRSLSLSWSARALMLRNQQQIHLSSGFTTDGAGKHHSFVGDRRVALSFALICTTFVASLHASPRAHRSFQSPPEIYPQISKPTDYADEEF